jgi:membrane protein DedA with SNARE-associated domain
VSIENFLATYGYLAIFVGVFIEGEAVVMTAGFLAYGGHLDLHWVIVSAFFGSVSVYQLFFFLGRSKGNAFLDARPRWRPRVSKIKDLLHRHHIWVILGYRVLFGFRVVTPFTLGMTQVTQRRFLLIDLLPAALWSITFSLLGYSFGQALETILTNIQKYELWIAFAFFVIILLIVAAYYVYQKLKRE